MRSIGKSGGAAPMSNWGCASGCVLPLSVTTRASLIGCVISGCRRVCCAPAQTTRERKTRKADRRGRGMDTATPLAGGSRERLNSESWAFGIGVTDGEGSATLVVKNIALSGTYASREFPVGLQIHTQRETAPLRD